MDEFPTPTYIRNHEAVLRAYGYWPSFHDAPLLSFKHDPKATTVDLAVHAAEMTAETDERAYFRYIKHHRIRLSFAGVEGMAIQEFQIPNTIFEMAFSPPSEFESTGRFEVELVSVFGGDCTLSFSATTGDCRRRGCALRLACRWNLTGQSSGESSLTRWRSRVPNL